MPYYSFTCKKCEHVYTELCKMGESAPCPECKSEDVKKNITAAGGYFMKGDNSASVRPKRAGSWKRGGN